MEDKDIHAFLEIFDKPIEGKKGGVLSGVKIAVKDNILVEGKIASAGSKMLEKYIAPYTATAVKKLLDEGAIIVGRTNMDEFAMGGSTEHSAYGPTRNPHDLNRVSGGSSGGSAAAVASGQVQIALGSDTGGSIRQPAGFCGVVGLKPTYGHVSRHGLMAMASSFDVVGAIAKTVSEVRKVFNVIKGKDSYDSTSVNTPELKGESIKRIGVPRKFLKEGVDPDVLKNFEESLNYLSSQGYEIVDVDIPTLPLSLAIYYILVPAEVSSNMARYDGIKYGMSVDGKDLKDVYLKTRRQGLGDEVRRRIMLGTYVLSTGYYDAFYGNASKARKLLKDDLNKVFETVGAIATPTSPTPAFKIGEKTNDPLSLYLEDIFTVGANIAGIPAISVPMGTVKREDKDLPVGIQFMAKAFGEETLFEIGECLERKNS